MSGIFRDNFPHYCLKMSPLIRTVMPRKVLLGPQHMFLLRNKKKTIFELSFKSPLYAALQQLQIISRVNFFCYVCSDAKKLCKNLKATPSTVELRHYKFVPCLFSYKIVFFHFLNNPNIKITKIKYCCEMCFSLLVQSQKSRLVL